MACAISLIVPVDSPGEWLTDLMTSVDAQSLSPGEFEVILERTTDDADVARRVEILASLRPNVVAAAPGQARMLVRGEWWLEVGSDLSGWKPTLPPDAIERIAWLADRTGLDVIVGSVAERGGGLVSDIFAGDSAERPTVDIPETRAVLTIRRAVSDGADQVAVLNGGPVMVVAALTQTGPLADLVVSGSTASWDHGRLVVTFTGTQVGLASDARLRVVLADVATGTEHVLPSAIDTTRASSDAKETDRFAGWMEFDPSSMDIEDGRWLVRLSLHADGSWCRQVTVPAVLVGAGLVSGRFVVPTAVEGALILDIGARRASPIGRLRVADAIVSDSARGTVLRVALPRLNVTDDADVPGFVVLGKLRLPGRVRVDDGVARLEVYVSGLAGSSTVATEFGRGRVTPTGLNVMISPTGVVTVVKTPPPIIPAAPATPTNAPPATSAPTAPTTSRPLMTRLRRRTPGSIEPAVQALARIPIFRRAYRALLRF